MQYNVLLLVIVYNKLLSQTRATKCRSALRDWRADITNPKLANWLIRQPRKSDIIHWTKSCPINGSWLEYYASLSFWFCAMQAYNPILHEPFVP